MRLTLKVTFAFLVVCVVVLAATARLRVDRERDHFEEQRDRSHRVLGALVAATIADVWARRGVEAARDVLREVQPATSPVHLRLVCVDSDPTALPVGFTCVQLRALRQRDVRSVVERDDPRDAAHLTYIAVPVDETRTEVLEIRESLEGEQRFVASSVRESVTSASLVVVVCGFASFLLGLVIVGVPARKLIAKASRVGRGDLTGPLGTRESDELGDLSRAMDAMCDQLSAARDRAEAETRAKLRAFEQLRHADRLTTVGKIASGLAHEIGTPLNVIEARASTVADGTAEGERAKTAGKAIVDAVERISRVVRGLLDFSRRQGEGFGPVAVRSLVEGTVEFLRPMATQRGVTLETHLEDAPGRLLGDALQLGQALTNVVMNALQASPRGTAVRVDVATVEVPPTDARMSAGTYVRISVADRANGVLPEHRDRLFEPFFTTKSVGEGTGLGLSVAWGIAAEHKGSLWFEDRPGGGSVFLLFIPAISGTQAAK